MKNTGKTTTLFLSLLLLIGAAFFLMSCGKSKGSISTSDLKQVRILSKDARPSKTGENTEYLDNVIDLKMIEKFGREWVIEYFNGRSQNMLSVEGIHKEIQRSPESEFDASEIESEISFLEKEIRQKKADKETVSANLSKKIENEIRKLEQKIVSLRNKIAEGRTEAARNSDKPPVSILNEFMELIRAKGIYTIFLEKKEDESSQLSEKGSYQEYYGAARFIRNILWEKGGPQYKYFCCQTCKGRRRNFSFHHTIEELGIYTDDPDACPQLLKDGCDRAVYYDHKSYSTHYLENPRVILPTKLWWGGREKDKMLSTILSSLNGKARWETKACFERMNWMNY